LYPLLLNFHYLDVYRHQVLKQADVVLAHGLLPNGVPRWQLRRDVAYYAARTPHDSSLSACAHAVASAELGDLATAIRFCDPTARTDRDAMHGSPAQAIRVAAMGGTCTALLEGLARLRIPGGGMSIRPCRPRRWERIGFRIAWRASNIGVSI